MQDNTQDRPLVTFALFAYNQEDYIRRAVEGAFAQSYEPLEIIISDDCSTDRTFEFIQQMVDGYDGPHRVIARKNAANVGIGPHVSNVVEQARGKYVALAAGDDISMPDRVERAMFALCTLPEADERRPHYSFLSTLALIDREGTNFGRSRAPLARSLSEEAAVTSDVALFGLQDLLSGVLYTSGPSRIIPKDLHLLFGEINADCFTEDVVYLFRSVLAGKVFFSNKDTVFYRKHDANVSAPETLYARPFEGVEAQLRADLGVAVDKGFLSSVEAKYASDWIDNNVAFRRFYRSKISGARPSFADLFVILKSRHLSGRRKFGIFREYIGVR